MRPPRIIATAFVALTAIFSLLPTQSGARSYSNKPIRLLHESAVKALNDPDSKKRFAKNGSTVDGGSAADFDKKIRAELALRKDIVAKQNIKLEQ